MVEKSSPLEVFCSYAHKNAPLYRYPVFGILLWAKTIRNISAILHMRGKAL